MISDSIHSRRKESLPAPHELFRDPSVQMDMQNNYIDTKISIKKNTGLQSGAFMTAKSENTANIRKINKSDFLLPTISNSRRLMQLDNEEENRLPNPFKIPFGTERSLALRERKREADKLERLKFRLIQQEAQGAEYSANLSRK